MTSGSDAIPQWMVGLAEVARRAKTAELTRFPPPDDGSAQESAVLLLFGETEGAADVLLTERAHSLRRHAGQVSFPGGAIDVTDRGPIDAALREGVEETDLDPSGLGVLTTMAPLWIPISNFVVTPVVAWWHEPSPVRPVDPGEVASVLRMPIPRLLDPAHRLTVRHPSGIVGPAFKVDDMLIWGFTAGLLARLFDLSGMARPWDHGRVEPLPPEVLAADEGRPRGADAQ